MIKQIVFVLLSAANFYYWSEYGRYHSTGFERIDLKLVKSNKCKVEAAEVVEEPCVRFFQNDRCSNKVNVSETRNPLLSVVNALQFDQYREPYLGPFRLDDEDTLILNFDGIRHSECHTYANMYATRGERAVNAWTMGLDYCVAAVRITGRGEGHTHNLLRFDIDLKFNSSNPQTGSFRPTGLTVDVMLCRSYIIVFATY